MNAFSAGVHTLRGYKAGVVNHVIAPDISVICGDAEERRGRRCVIDRQDIARTLSRGIVVPIVLYRLFCRER